jgi:hypothetical protein
LRNSRDTAKLCGNRVRGRVDAVHHLVVGHLLIVVAARARPVMLIARQHGPVRLTERTDRAVWW